MNKESSTKLKETLRKAAGWLGIIAVGLIGLSFLA